MRTVVAVLRGGPSSEYDVSLKTGASVLSALNKEKYDARDVFISRGGEWHLGGVPVAPERALRGTDVAFNAMHGHYGEDGTVQRLLDSLSIPYTGSGAHASALAFNKHRTREAVAPLGIKIPHGILIDAQKITDLERTAHNIFRSMPHPAIVKPAIGGSSIGTSIADSYHALLCALQEAQKHADKILIEEFIKGRQATVGVIDNFRGEKLYALFPTEIVLPPGTAFYDYNTKYAADPHIVSPAEFTGTHKKLLENAARAVHEGLGLSHYSRSDFIVSARGVYFLEVNTLPDIFETSEFWHMLKAAGTGLSHFLDHVITLARSK